MLHIPSLGRIVLSLSLVTGFLTLSPKLHAQQQTIITTHVPFAFSADGQRFDAGQYEIQALNPFVLRVLNITTHQSRLLMVSDMGLKDISANGRLLFHKYGGDEHYLYQVWMPGMSEFSELRPTKQERLDIAQAKSTKSSGVVEALVIPTPVR